MSSLIIEVCKVDNIIKHPNADKLSIVTIKGWQCIVGLDQYKVGDLVVYCPPDSVIPENLIEKYGLTYLKNGGRIGTVKLRKYLSEGLILSLPEGKYKVGDNVAEVLGITKWQPPEPSFNKQANPVSKKKQNPNFDKYSDIENIKNYKGIFKEGDFVVVLEKIHGSNARFGTLPIVIDKSQPLKYRLKKMFEKYILKRTHEWIYGSHNIQLHGDKNNYYGQDLWGKVANKYNLKSLIPNDYIVYGEVFGKGVQDLTYGLDDIDLIVFDIKYKGQYLPWDTVKHLCEMWGLKVVPELYIGNWNDELLKLHTDGKSVICPKQIREGCIIKMVDESKDMRIGRKILKSVSIDYLTRKNATEFH